MTPVAKNILALTLVELVVGTAILMICALPALALFTTSNRTLERTDERRAAYFHIDQVFAKLNRTSLHFLWDNFGPPEFAGAGKMRDRVAETDQNGKLLASPGANPLGFSQDFLEDLVRDDYEVRIRFEFFSKGALRSQNTLFFDKADSKIGILHMQAGWARVSLLDRKALMQGQTVTVAHQVRVIMCPAIVGRPGMKLASCPALSTLVKAKYGGLLETREQALGSNPPW